MERHSPGIYRISLGYSRPSSVKIFSLDVSRIASVIARVALY